MNTPQNPERRNLLKAGGVAAVATAAAAAGLAACGEAAQTTAAAASQASSAGKPSPDAAGRAAPVAGEDALPRRRKLGALEVSSLGLGCQGFGQDMYGVPEPSQEQSIKIIRQAFDHGITFFDTAEAYGPFKSETVVSKAIKPFRDQIVLATKYGWDIDQETGQRKEGRAVNSKPDHIRIVVDNMLKRLQTDRIDLLYQHRADPEVPVEELALVIQDLIKQGKVLHWGLCEVSPQTIRKAHAIQPLAAIQSEYSLFFRGREKDVLPVCKELGIGFVPWSPLAMGALGGYVNEQTVFDDPQRDLRVIIPRFAPEAMKHNIALINLVKKWAQRKLCTPAQFSLAWLQAQGDFIVPIPGTTKSYHLMDNLGADGVRFTADELSAFTKELDAIKIEGLRLPEAILDFSEVAQGGVKKALPPNGMRPV